MKIEKNIPIPKNRTRSAKWITTLRKMKIGDSFVVPATQPRPAIHTAAKRLDIKITISSGYERTMDEMRVFRVRKNEKFLWDSNQ